MADEEDFDVGDLFSNTTKSDSNTLVPIEKVDVKTYWEKKASIFSNSVEGMLLEPNAAKWKLDEKERTEIISYLPPIESHHRVLDVGAGIGRYTSFFAPLTKTGKVTASDIVASFIEENKKRHEAFPHVSCIASDANDLRFPTASFDLVFANWLLMYLTDDQLDKFADRLFDWIAPGGRLFFRESCEASISGVRSASTPAQYRSGSQYTSLFESKGFILERRGNMKLYVKRYNNPNQLWWCWKRP